MTNARSIMAVVYRTTDFLSLYPVTTFCEDFPVAITMIYWNDHAWAQRFILLLGGVKSKLVDAIANK